MKKFLVVLATILSCSYPLKSQDWVKTFTDGSWVDVAWVIETYDKGFLILDNENPPGYIWLIKTDINGVKLWEKKIGSGQYQIRFWNIEQTLDGGYILTGGFNKYDINNEDPVLIKLNSCGELDWCSVINTVGIYDFGTRAKQTLEGDYILVAQGSVFIPCQNVQLFKFDNSGNLLWKHIYCPDSLIWSPNPYDVRVDSDGYLISGMCYYPDNGNPTIGWERPYYIKTDTSGNILWWLVYGSVNGYHGFIYDATIKSSTGNFYSTGVHSNFCDNTALTKCMGNGQESYYHDFVPGLCPGGYFSSINFVNDSTLISIACGTLNGNSIHRWLIMDTLGVMQSYKDFPSWICSTTHTTKALDNKFVSTAPVNDFWIYLYKLNSSMDYDSIYTHQFIYDSLCPGGVISDTINPDCGLITSIDDPKVETQLSQLKIYPNPASNIITVEFPKYLKQIEKKSGITSTSFYYQWNSTTLEIYDPTGKLIYSKEIPKSLKNLELEVSSWKNGVYFARLLLKNNLVGNDKFIILK